MSMIPRKSRTRQTALGLVIAAITGTTLAACGGGSGGAGGAAALAAQTWVVPQDWGAIDPTQVAATNTGAILLVTEPLVLADGQGGVLPNLAQQTTPDANTFVYRLRPDVRFTNGKAITIDDVLYSFQIHMDKGSKSTLAKDFDSVKSIAATGPNELTIKLSGPDVFFQDRVARVGIVSKAVRQTLGSAPGSPGKTNVGSGPFVVDSYKPGSELVLKRNANYWGEKPKQERLTLRVIPDDSARLLAVQSGEVTGAFDIPAAQAESYGKAKGMKLITGANPSVMLMNVNLTKAPWNDVHVRKAVAMATDKKGIVNAVLKGKGTPAPTVVSNQSLSELLPADKVKSLLSEVDAASVGVDAAKAELSRSRTPNGFRAKVVYSETEASSGLVAQAMKSNLIRIGIDLTVEPLPDSQYTDAVFFKHTAPAAIVDFTTDLPDPMSLPSYLTSSAQTLAGGGYTNIAEYRSAAQDTILGTYARTPPGDKPQRGQLLTAALKNMSADMPYIPIYNADYIAVLKADLNFAGFDGMWWMRRWPSSVSAS